MAQDPKRKVAVYVVTYRRHHMLKRAIQSVLQQTHSNLVLHVVNDDPADQEVDSIVAECADPRAQIFRPVEKRGATCNFNLVFQEQMAAYSALLEDDNWWEPTFLERQLAVLDAYPGAPMVVGNERIWKELPGGVWQDTGKTIWPFRVVSLYRPTLEDLCGGAKLCNSSLLVRTARDVSLLTPENIPVDVTEHFRERLMPSAFPLNGEPLVNFAQTIGTARDQGRIWGLYQIALIGSAFVALADATARHRLAKALWRASDSPTSPRASTLVSTGIAISEARALISCAPMLALARSALGFVRHISRVHDILSVRRSLGSQIDFLVKAPLTQELAKAF
jgi:glycosyltransferase involved in cell wall biosynthesis